MIPALLLSLAVLAAPDTVMVKSVTDGDTFVTTDGTKVRIIGIDAPESDPNSTQFLDSLIGDSHVILTYEGDRRDKYGRALAFVKTMSGEDVSKLMTRFGWAITYLKYPCSKTDDLLQEEIQARRAGRGIWTAHFTSTLPIQTAKSQPKRDLLAEVQSAQAAQQEQYISPAVALYRTQTGTKYHRTGCRHLSKSAIPITAESAVANYAPCGTCKPEYLTAGASSPPNTSSVRAAPSYSSGRCQATTKKGTQCKRSASSGSSYCWQHQ